MEKEVAGKFTLRREGKLSTPKSAAVIDGDTVIVETLPTPYRYYVVPAVTGLLALSVSSTIGEATGEGSFWWEFLGMGGGVLAGMAVAFILQSRKQDGMMEGIRDGDRGLDNDIIVKKGKISRIEYDEDDGSLSIVSPRHEFELLGDADELRRVYDALT